LTISSVIDFGSFSTEKREEKERFFGQKWGKINQEYPLIPAISG